MRRFSILQGIARALAPHACLLAALALIPGCRPDACLGRPPEVQVDVEVSVALAGSTTHIRVELEVNGGAPLSRTFVGASASFAFDLGGHDKLPHTLLLSAQALDGSKDDLGSASLGPVAFSTDGCNHLRLEIPPRSGDGGLDAGQLDLGLDGLLDMAGDQNLDVPTLPEAGQDLPPPVDLALDAAVDLVEPPDLVIDAPLVLDVGLDKPPSLDLPADQGVAPDASPDAPLATDLWPDLPAAPDAMVDASSTGPGWAVKATGTQIEGRALARDSSGNTYIIGHFEGTATLGATTLTAVMDADMFVAKLNPKGVFEWAVHVGGKGGQFGKDIVVDGAGNIYVTGFFQGKQIPFGTHTLTTAGDRDLFVARLDSAGTFKWAVRGGGTGKDEGWALAVDGAGNVHVAGSFEGTATLGGSSYTSGGARDVFVARLDNAGTFKWVAQAGGGAEQAAYSIATEGTGASVITGAFWGSPTFGVTPLTSAGQGDVFVSRLDGKGVFQWAVKGGGTGDDVGQSVVLDGAGNIHVVGRIGAKASLGSTTLTPAGGDDAFVAKLSSGGTYQWAVGAGGTAADEALGVAVDSASNVHVTGLFNGAATFGSVPLTSAGLSDIYVARLDSSGVFQAAIRAGGTDLERGMDIEVDGAGTLSIVGFFKSPSITLGSTTLTPNTKQNLFVWRQ